LNPRSSLPHLPEAKGRAVAGAFGKALFDFYGLAPL